MEFWVLRKGKSSFKYYHNIESQKSNWFSPSIGEAKFFTSKNAAERFLEQFDNSTVFKNCVPIKVIIKEEE